MNEDAQRAWKNNALDVVFRAMAESASLRGYLIFKGGRILHLLLPSMPRQSYDLDAALTSSFVTAFPDREAQRAVLERELSTALSRYFERQDIVRYQLNRITVTLNPRADHPRGWNAFDVAIYLADNTRADTRGIPRLELDVVAQEALGEHAITSLVVDGAPVKVYALHRVAGEKLRAYLTSLRAYREKLRRPGDSIRAKDIYDVAQIVKQRPLSDEHFWRLAGHEFRLACESRFVDCSGRETFEIAEAETASTYRADTTIPKDIDFDEAWVLVMRIVERFEREGVVPFDFPLPERAD